MNEAKTRTWSALFFAWLTYVAVYFFTYCMVEWVLHLGRSSRRGELIFALVFATAQMALRFVRAYKKRWLGLGGRRGHVRIVRP